MSIFNIDKTVTQLGIATAKIDTAVAEGFLSAFQMKMGPEPEGRTRMIFKNLLTPDGAKLPEIELLIDPQSITVDKQVLQQKKLTKGGMVVQFWGHDLTIIEVQATSGNFQPMYGIGLTLPASLKPRDLKDYANQAIARWAQGGGPLKVFEKLKEYAFTRRFDPTQPWVGNPVIDLMWEDLIYQGYFTKFNYTLSANQPFHISYSFTFIVIKRRDMGAEDLFGSTDLKKLVSDPLGTIKNKTKQLTSVGASWAKKTASQAINKFPIANAINSWVDILDDLPDKFTLW